MEGWQIGRGPTDNTDGWTTVTSGGEVIARFKHREHAEVIALIGRGGDKVIDAIVAILVEHQRATKLHGRFNSAHEGWAVFQEESEEMWDEIKANAPAHARKEAVQVGAMVVRMLAEVL